MNTKHCPRCKKPFPQSSQYFYRNKNSKDGLSSYCKNCSKENLKEWYKKTGGVAIPKCLPGFKWCNACQTCLPATSEFFNHYKNSKDGLCTTCRECNKKRSKKWHKKNCPPKNIPPKTYKLGEHKACTKCGESFPATLDYFNRDNSQYSGLHPWCKNCISKKGQEWAKENKEHVREWRRKYREQNQHIYKANRAKRKAKIRGTNGSINAYEWQAIKNHYCPDNHCLCCGKKRKMTLDHVQPISKNGKHLSFNIQPICGRCNSRKYNKHIDYRPDKGNFAMLVYLGNILKG